MGFEAPVRVRFALALTLVAAVFSLTPVSAPASSQYAVGEPPAGRLAPDVVAALQAAPSVRVIISLRAPAAPSSGATARAAPAARAAIAAAGTRVIAAVPPADFQVDRRYQATPALAGRATAAGAQTLAAQPDVRSVALDRTVSADLAEAVPLIRADAAQSVLGVTGAGVVVAVLDTGIDTDHPMLADSLIHQECYLIAGVCPSAPNGAEDGSGHGTHVSGIITSNGPPVGVAPGASIEAFKVLDDTGHGEFSDVLLAYDHIIASHAEVDLVNMSLGDGGSYAPGTCDGLIPAVDADLAASRAMGITSFAAAGNNHDKMGLGYPACLTDVVAVGAVYDANLGATSCDATTAPDQITCFSQSDDALDLLAPGSSIQSTWPGGGLANLSGTSMASPMAVGVAALVLEGHPSLSPADLEARLKTTGRPRGDVNGVITCRVDAYEAVISAGGPVCPPMKAKVGGVAAAPDLATLPAARTPDGRGRSALPYAAAALVIATGGIVLRRRVRYPRGPR